MNAAAYVTYQDQLEASAAQHGVPAPILAGLIEHESAWDPRAYRVEVKIGDASRGLGQLLLRTAQGLGFDGSPDDLFDPATNMDLTAQYLALKYQQAGSWAGALSAYNGGYAPSRGMGRPATIPLHVVLARDQTTGLPISTRAVAPGEYGNQPYVDSVLGLAADFGWGGDAPAAAEAPQSPATDQGDGAGSALGCALLLLAVGLPGALLWLGGRG